MLILFDVASLFPSVPIPETLEFLRELLSNNNFDPSEIDEYVRLTALCMSQNCFQINGKFFEQLEGTAMGNCLSPFIANLFMSRFETNVKSKAPYFPKTWVRYVDDIFAIFDTKKCSVQDFLLVLNSEFNTINFTVEQEVSGQLPFLDTLVVRNSKNIIEINKV